MIAYWHRVFSPFGFYDVASNGTSIYAGDVLLSCERYILV